MGASCALFTTPDWETLTMATTPRKRIVITAAPVLPAWHGQFVAFVEHTAETCKTHDEADQALLLAVDCIADMGNVRGPAYAVFRDAARLYLRLLCCYRLANRATHAAPGPWEGKPTVLLEAQSMAWAQAEIAGKCLRTAMRDVRPSLSMT